MCSNPKRCDYFDWDQVDTCNEEALAHDRGFKVSSGFRIAPNGSNQAPRGTNDFPYALAVSGNKRAMRVLPR